MVRSFFYFMGSLISCIQSLQMINGRTLTDDTTGETKANVISQGKTYQRMLSQPTLSPDLRVLMQTRYRVIVNRWNFDWNY